MVKAAIANGWLEVGVASSILTGQSQSGDLELVRTLDRGALVAVVDGIGHGQEAAVAARVAVDTLDRHAGESLPALVRRCHDALLGTRGVVMSVAHFDAGQDTMTWVGLGNVEGVLVAGDHVVGRPYTSLVTRAGIVGNASAGLPPVRPWVIPILRRDILVLATDGLRANFGEDVAPSHDPQQTATMLLERHGKKSDDALVLVARYLGRR
jgi:negative regulator of sigma-B (phosphoserine phosphatase)